TSVCSGVSIEQARGFRLKTQWLYIGYITSSIGVLGPRFGSFRYSDFIARTLSRYSDAKPSRFAVRKSPPEPFSQRTSTGSCVSGSVSVNFDEVLPPPVFVKVKSSPSLFEPYTKRSTPSNWPATSSCQRYFTNRNLSLPGLCELIKLLLQ